MGFTSEEDRSQAHRLVSQLQGAVRAEAARQGWILDGTADLARLLRLPGTFNQKGVPVKEVAIEQLTLERRYDPADFVEVLPELPLGEASDAERIATRKNWPPADLAAVVAGCAWLRHCHDDAATLAEPEWYAMLGIVGRCASPEADGRELAHQWSADYPGCTRTETDRKLDHALGAAGPRTCRHIASRLGAHAAYCGTCPHHGKIKSPINLGGRQRAQEESRQRKCRQVVLIGNDEKRVNDETRGALSGHPDLFRRGDALVHIVKDEGARESALHLQRAPRIVLVTEPLLREMVAERVDFRRPSGKKKLPASPPQACVRAIAARGNWPELRLLEGITETPVLRPDGSVLQQPGYDTATGLLYIPRVAYPAVPVRPTLAQVREALALLRKAVGDFPFAGERHRSAFLAALLTIQGRHAFSGPAPCNLLDSNTRGCGKGLLVSVAVQIATGRPVARMPYSRDPEEQRKMILSLALQGERVVLFDNVAGTFGSATLDAALTAPDWSDRLLGVSKAVKVPLHIVWFATGNNVAVVGDTVRRCLLIRLESPDEHPERRTGFEHPRLLDWVVENQGHLAVAGLTLLRAYFEAGRPDQHLAPWGSYEGWSDLIRNCLVWLGLPDPAETRDDLYESASCEGEVLDNLIAGLQELFGSLDGQCGTAREILAELASATPERYVQLREALAELVPRPGSGDLPTARQLGEVLKRYRGRVLSGRVIERAQERKTKRGVLWCVQGSSGDAGDSGDSDSPQRAEFPTTWRGREAIPAWREEESPASPESPDGGLQRWLV